MLNTRYLTGRHQVCCSNSYWVLQYRIDRTLVQTHFVAFFFFRFLLPIFASDRNHWPASTATPHGARIHAPPMASSIPLPSSRHVPSLSWHHHAPSISVDPCSLLHPCRAMTFSWELCVVDFPFTHDPTLHFYRPVLLAHTLLRRVVRSY